MYVARVVRYRGKKSAAAAAIISRAKIDADDDDVLGNDDYRQGGLHYSTDTEVSS